MNDQNLNSSVTCVTKPSLMQLLRKRRTPLAIVISDEQKKAPSPDLLGSSLPKLIREWIEICLNEGHMQPSQPKVGRLEGWPLRPYLKNSLYVDFWCWCRNKGMQLYLIPPEASFYQTTDLIFDALGDEKYQFPVIEICREIFLKLKEGIDDYRKTADS